ncbi:MAG: peptidyl-tRNA hydrolase Pth2 [Candidatus Aenigmatarchaeota archaeon]
MKQAIVLRTDLKMGKGKIASQASHASLSAFMKADPEKKAEWKEEGSKKVVLKVKDEDELMKIYGDAVRAKLPAVLIIDKGLTQVPESTATAVGIGPDEDAKIDKITGKLKLL